MKNIRLIARLDIKGPHLIKSVNLEGLRIIGDPKDYAQKYYAAGIDELLCLDVVASLYGRNNLIEVIKHTAQRVFIPITVGGGVRSLDDVETLLHAGADKVAINTAAVQRPALIQEVARRYGSQCMVLSIEAKRVSQEKWEVYTDNGREKTGLDVVEWAKKAMDLGAGEILLTSIDQEGTRKGFDLDLIKAVSTSVAVPVIASGGMGSTDHLVAAVKQGFADAVAFADIIHYKRKSVSEIKDEAVSSGIAVRRCQQ